jgi:flagellar biosynthesis protein FlhF
MQIHRVLGRTLKDALHKARRVHGDGAVVLSQESVAGGGIAIAVADPKRATQTLRRARVSAPRTMQVTTDPPGFADVRRRMERNGASLELVARVLAAVEKSGGRGPYAIDAAALAIGRAFPVAPSPKVEGGTHAIAFAGPTGVGKTTTLAKLAIRLVQSGRRVALVTMDTYRVGAIDQVRTYAELLQIPMHVARNGAELADVLARDTSVDVALVDTTGRSPSDAEHLGQIAESLDEVGETVTLDTYLVLAASARPGDLDEAASGFGATSPAGVVFTKLDETREPVAALEYSLYSGLGLVFLCDGQDVRGHLHRPHPERLADLSLRGRIS